jgi:hypothetical protein
MVTSKKYSSHDITEAILCLGDGTSEHTHKNCASLCPFPFKNLTENIKDMIFIPYLCQYAQQPQMY